MYLSKSDIENTSKIKRLNIINSVTGIKPANLIGTSSDSGIPNLTIISSVVHLGSDPALIGFIMRPKQEVRRDTFQNIMDTGLFTINHIHSHFIKNAHYTSAKFDDSTSEFDSCGLSSERIENFKAPFVKESSVQIGMKFIMEIPIELNETILMIGQVEYLVIKKDTVLEDGNIDLNRLSSVCTSGQSTYHKAHKLKSLPYAKTDSIPKLKSF